MIGNASKEIQQFRPLSFAPTPPSYAKNQSLLPKQTRSKCELGNRYRAKQDFDPNGVPS